MPKEWPRFMYRPNGENRVFRSPEDVPSGWITLDEYNVLKERAARPAPPAPAEPEAAVLDVLAGAGGPAEAETTTAEVEGDELVSLDDDAPTDPVEIPDDWRSLHHTKRIALATKIKGEKVASAADADDIIAAEVARRA